MTTLLSRHCSNYTGAFCAHWVVVFVVAESWLFLSHHFKEFPKLEICYLGMTHLISRGLGIFVGARDYFTHCPDRALFLQKCRNLSNFFPNISWPENLLSQQTYIIKRGNEARLFFSHLSGPDNFFSQLLGPDYFFLEFQGQIVFFQKIPSPPGYQMAHP